MCNHVEASHTKPKDGTKVDSTGPNSRAALRGGGSRTEDSTPKASGPYAVNKAEDQGFRV